MTEENFFTKNNLTTQLANLEDIKLDEAYPIYGCITNILEELDRGIVAEVNFNLKIHMLIESNDKIEILKEKSFEPGIFIVKFSSKSDDINDKYILSGTCSTVVFGRKQGFNC